MNGKLAIPAMVLALSLAWPAMARVEEPLRYSKEQSFSTALRFLRIDNGYTVTEKDSETGYLLFEYPEKGGSGKVSGSIEIVDRGDSVAIVIQLPKLPTYYEQHLADALLKKLRADYGEPPKRAPQAKPEEPRKKEQEAPEKKPPKLPHGQSLPGS